jgi:hypothetical protein
MEDRNQVTPCSTRKFTLKLTDWQWAWNGTDLTLELIQFNLFSRTLFISFLLDVVFELEIVSQLSDLVHDLWICGTIEYIQIKFVYLLWNLKTLIIIANSSSLDCRWCQPLLILLPLFDINSVWKSVEKFSFFEIRSRNGNWLWFLSIEIFWIFPRFFSFIRILFKIDWN